MGLGGLSAAISEPKTLGSMTFDAPDRGADELLVIDGSHYLKQE